MYAKFGEDTLRIAYSTVLYKSELFILTLLCVDHIIKAVDLVAVIHKRRPGLLLDGRTLNHYKYYTNKYFGL